MRLKKIVIVGFKSFAEKTVLHFDAGVTCIVGPNGCGKSNIADAFRWVFGEQSAKSMRGNKMPDVIFAGTHQRKPLNVAEVSLTLTDIQGALPVDYEEITITRRLHRSGESEYFLNGNAVRLKDIQSLLLDSGMGRHAFSIFEQGKIDQVINYTPLERRYIFEEAAGILRFLQRKRDALKRLEQAEGNLDRVRDVYQEVERYILVLQEQAQKAKIFKENQLLLEELEKASFVLRWNGLEKKWIETENRQQKQQAYLMELNQGLIQLQAKNQAAKAFLEQQEKTLRVKNEELYKIRSEKEIHTREHLSNQEYLKEAQQKEKKFKRELEELRVAQQTRQKALQDIQHKQKKIEEDFQDAQDKLVSQQDRLKLKEKNILQLSQQLHAKQQQHLQILQHESQTDTECKQNEVRLDNNRERKKSLDERACQTGEDLNMIAQQVKERKQHLQQISALIDTYKDRLEQCEDELKRNGQEAEKKQKEAEVLRRKLMEQKARQSVLIKMREDHEGFSSGSKRLLQESHTPHSPFYNKIKPLYEFLNPNPEEAEALAIILRVYAHTLVVETEQDLEAVIRFAQDHQMHDYSLLCVEWVRREIKEGEKNRFLMHVSSNQVAKHFLKDVQAVATHQEAIHILRDCLKGPVWSQQGAFFDHYHVFFSASLHENHIFLREAELKKLEEELMEKEDVLKVWEAQIQVLQQAKSKLQLERSEIDKMLRRDEMKLVEVNFGLQRSLADQEKLKNEQMHIQKELTGLDQQIEQQHNLVKQLKDKHFVAKQELVQLRQEVEFLEKDLEAQRSALRIQQQDHADKQGVYQKLVEDKQQLLHQHHLLEAKEQDHHKQEQRVEEELEEAEELQRKIKEKGTHFYQRLEVIEQSLAEATASYSCLEQELEAHKMSLAQIEQEIASQFSCIRKEEEENNQLSIQLAQQHSTAQSLENELHERYGLSIEEAKPMLSPLAKSLEQTEKQIRTLRQALQSAGDVNLASIEELEKHQVRYQFLNQQMNDMAQSKQELLQIITELDTQSHTIFRKTFDLIRANFQKNFQILFNGGEADLQFTETDNILEAGIDIIAKPPGKQMRSITLLSGGEKCLTAVALLFAIFEVKPSPFCILDEIDAPLDDTNVERFVNVVKHFINRCQFLIITHNKRTMAVGDVLFGISMEEKGVSKVLALEFSHEAAPEAALI